MKKLIIIITLIAFHVAIINAQKNLDRVKLDMYHVTKGYITEGKTIQGYYDYYSIGEDYRIFDQNGNKIGNLKKVIDWGIDISDESGNLINSFKFQDIKGLRMIESAYTNGMICFQFANYKDKSINYKIFDVKGKKLLDYTFDLDNSEWRKYESFTMVIEDEPGNNSTLFSLDESSFYSMANCEIGKNNSFKVIKFNPKAERKVETYTYEAISKMNFVHSLGVKNGVGYFKVLRGKGIFMKDILIDVLAIDFSTMKKVFETKGEELGEFIFDPTNLIEDPTYKTVKLLGTYFKNEDNIFKDESQGMALWELAPDGTLLREKYRNWGKDFNGFLGFNEKGKAKDFGYCFVHRTFKLSGGDIIVIGEGYRMQANAAGIASMALGAGGSANKLQITNLAIFKFDHDFNFIKGDLYKKNSNDFSLGAQAIASSHLMAQVAKRYGAFDYNYTQINDDRSEFIVFYTDCVRKNFFKPNDYKHFFLRYSDKEVIKDVIEIKRDRNFFGEDKILKSIYENQFQIILLWEYNKKERKISNNIIKIK
ncbi:MAG: DUF6770 family protein [Chitinophagales bacterium]